MAFIFSIYQDENHRTFEITAHRFIGPIDFNLPNVIEPSLHVENFQHPRTSFNILSILSCILESSSHQSCELFIITPNTRASVLEDLVYYSNNLSELQFQQLINTNICIKGTPNNSIVKFKARDHTHLLTDAIIKNEVEVLALLLSLKNKNNDPIFQPKQLFFGIPKQSLLDIATTGRISMNEMEYHSSPRYSSEYKVFMLLKKYGVTRETFTLQEKNAGRVILQAIRTHQVFQRKLIKEKEEAGSFIRDTFNDLNEVFPGYFAHFLKVRLNGYPKKDQDHFEFKQFDESCSPVYERMGNDSLIEMLRWAKKPMINLNSVSKDKIKIFCNMGITDEHVANDDTFDWKKISSGPGRLDLYPSIYSTLRSLYPLSSYPPAAALLPTVKFNLFFQKISKKVSRHLIYKFLVEALKPLDGFKKRDQFSALIFHKILSTLEFIALYDNLDVHYNRIAQLYIYVMSLVRVVVCYEAPYLLTDYQNAINLVQAERLGLKDVYLSHYPATSGMDAMLTSFVAERKQSQNSKVNIISIADPLYQGSFFHHIYFEIETIFRFEENRSNHLRDIPSPEFFIAGLTSEHQVEGFASSRYFIESMATIKAACRKVTESQYITLIIEEVISFEREKDPVIQFINGLKEEIHNGQINILLCKSWQKFSSLGTSFIKLGNITLINNRASKFSFVRSYLENNLPDLVRESFYEIQIATYFLKYLSENEYHFIEQASKNAKTLKKMYFSTDDDVYVSGPFILAPSKRQSFKVPCVTNFGFIYTSTGGGNPRISVGLEVAKNPNLVTRSSENYNSNRYIFWFNKNEAGELYGNKRCKDSKIIKNYIAEVLDSDEEGAIEGFLAHQLTPIASAIGSGVGDQLAP